MKEVSERLPELVRSHGGVLYEEVHDKRRKYVLKNPEKGYRSFIYIQDYLHQYNINNLIDAYIFDFNLSTNGYNKYS